MHISAQQIADYARYSDGDFLNDNYRINSNDPRVIHNKDGSLDVPDSWKAYDAGVLGDIGKPLGVFTALAGGAGLVSSFTGVGATDAALSVSTNVVSPGELQMLYDPDTGLELGFNDTGSLISSSGGGSTTYYDPITPAGDSSIYTGADPTISPNPVADSSYVPGAANPTIATQLGSVAKTIAQVPTSLLSRVLSLFSPAAQAQTPVYDSRGVLIGYRAGIGGGFNATGNPSIAPAGSTPIYNSQGQLVGYRNASASFTGWLVGGVILAVLLFILAIGRR